MEFEYAILLKVQKIIFDMAKEYFSQAIPKNTNEKVWKSFKKFCDYDDLKEILRKDYEYVEMYDICYSECEKK